MGGEEKWCVVTGGRGFAARHLVVMLIRYGMYSVRIADLEPSIELDDDEENGVLGEAMKSGRADYVSADLRHKAQAFKVSFIPIAACIGVVVVFHMAAPDSSINNHRLHYSVNVQGTQNIIDACSKLKIKRLIYTSSPSVVFDGVHGISNGNESLPYPAKHYDSYSATKAEGESLVINSNGSNGLLTCSIRPSSIFGPGDRLFVPSLVSAVRSGKLKFIIGDGKNMYDFTYVENVAHAHICAERALASGGATADKASGQAYFITNGEPLQFWEFVSIILEGLGYERPRTKVPAFLVLPIAHMAELIYKIIAPFGMKVPQLIPSRVRLLSVSRTFDCSKANDLLGYTPIVPLQEGIRRTIDSYQHWRAGVEIERKGPSKAELLLGTGKVAEALLWRDIKLTLTVLALGCKLEKISGSKFHLSAAASHHFALSVVSIWNSTAREFKSLCKGNDNRLFLKVVLSLLLLSILGAISAHNVFAIGLPVLFFCFALYDKKEKQIDKIGLTAIAFAYKLKSRARAKINLRKKQ
ncbi:hypothetical protein SASPL_151010 [Salvia splendens]|uniref:Reticulon-like protein n=1 Tax=Salvia splendens TaxID=180675 RepID=A0A8X8W7Y5_SALSN|nr:hypothetical protein SASPL_151010 [Salvia splendens]